MKSSHTKQLIFQFSVVFALALSGLMLLHRVQAFVPTSGAIFTTNVGCGGININIYASKDDVYLNGGPTHPGAAGLPNGSYYVQVTEPNGTVLGKSQTAAVMVSGGEFSACYQLSSLVYTASSSFTNPGYDTTSNPGGEYKVWVSTDSSFPPSSSKTDNFKVKGDSTNPPPTAHLRVRKFYDANTDGMKDPTEPFLTGWKVLIEDGLSLFRYTPVNIIVDPGDYTVTECPPIEMNWLRTTQNPQSVTLERGEDETVTFGNVCLGAGGGLTLGFWSNKNGQALVGGDDLALLVALQLRHGSGAAFDPASYTEFRSWLLSATATNMAYMLSAQLAAMELNVLNGKVNGTALIHAPGTNSANALGFATVNAVMNEADAELGMHGTAYAGDAWRAYQEALKNALDRANNNKTFVQSAPCPFTFPSE
jgi:hypothetical protein